MFSKNKLAWSVVAAVAATSGMANAQSPQIEEVVVTAQKREQTLQEVPVAVSAFGGDFMKKANITDVRGLVDFTPGFAGRTEDSFTDAMSMRGVVTNDFGIGGDPSVAVFQDGVWAGRTGGVQMSFYDIARAEVVKGPQGTLFGRNAIAGAVEIVTNKPTDEFEANVELTLAEYNHLQTTGTINQPLNDNWYLRASVYTLKNDGFLENMQGGDDLGYHDNKSGRIALRYAGDKLDVTATYSVESRDQDPSVYYSTFWPGSENLPEDKVNIDLKGGEGYDVADIELFTLHADYEINDNYSLSSITAYKAYDFDYLEDYDAGPLYVNNYRQANDVEYVSQDIRLNFAGDTVNWFVGASAYRETIDGEFEARYSEDDMCIALSLTDADDFDFSLDPSGMVDGCDNLIFEDYWGEDIDPNDILADKSEFAYVDVENDGWAVFGDVTYSATEALDLTVGARYTVDNKWMSNEVLDSEGALYNHFNYEFWTTEAITDSHKWSEFTPRFAANYTLSEEVSLYANASKGYKSGGYATFGFTVENPDYGYEVTNADVSPSRFDPEEVMSYEIGAKTKLLDNSMNLNIALFAYDYTDLQLVYFDQGSSQVANMGEAEGRGIEADLRYLPAENWDIYASWAYLDTEITDDTKMVDLGGCGGCAGNALPFSPEITASAVVTYEHPMAGGNLFFTGEIVYQDEMYGGADNFESTKVDAWTEMGLRTGYQSDNDWSVTFYVENLTNELYYERGWENAEADDTYGYGLVNAMVWPSKPRTMGLTLQASF